MEKAGELPSKKREEGEHRQLETASQESSAFPEDCPVSQFSLLFVHEALRRKTQPPPPSKGIDQAAPWALPERKKKKKGKEKISKKSIAKQQRKKYERRKKILNSKRKSKEKPIGKNKEKENSLERRK